MHYEPVIGLEIHARMNTRTKMFSRAHNVALPEEPNSTVTALDMGFPGMLPVLNKEAIRLGATAALALGCTVRTYFKFDRKNYFYPDLPLGYQISQFDEPIAEHGQVTVELAEGTKTIGITRLHLENDAGKLTHVPGSSLCDYNRSGAPLMEIVSEPDMRSMEEASAYAQELQRILRACHASDCDMEKGMMRFDLNISLRKKGVEQFGTKVEVKNLNSFRSLERAVLFEIARQADLLDRGEAIKQETRGWDDTKEATVSQRSKEEAADYRYFPEPDLPPVRITEAFIEELRATLPELPLARKLRYVEQYSLDEDTARILSSDYSLGNFFETLAKESGNFKAANSWTVSIVLKYLNEAQKKLEETHITTQDIIFLIQKVDEGSISNLQAKEVFEEYFNVGGQPEAIIEAKGFKQVSSLADLEPLCQKVIAANPEQVAAYKGGKDKLLGFFVGQVMKESKGQANPKIVDELVKKFLDQA